MPKKVSLVYLCLYCHARLEPFIISLCEALSSNHTNPPFLSAIEKLCFTTKHRALAFQKDSSFCGFQSLHIGKLLMDHRASFSDVPLTPMGPLFADYVLSIFNADRVVRVEPPGKVSEGVSELSCASKPFRATRRLFRPLPSRMNARRPPPSKEWKARRLRPNLSWPLPQRKTPVPRSSSVESGARCRMAIQQMYLTSWSVTNFSSMSRPSNW